MKLYVFGSSNQSGAQLMGTVGDKNRFGVKDSQRYARETSCPSCAGTGAVLLLSNQNKEATTACGRCGSTGRAEMQTPSQP